MLSRAGRVPTGIDRVELAYLRHLAGCDVPLFAIARSSFGYLLLDGTGISEITARIDGVRTWGAMDWLSRLARGKSAATRRAESDLRRLCLDRCRPGRLESMLARQLPRGVAYLNTGHSNLSDRMLRALKEAAAAHVAVMIHDTIPLDYPQLQRPGMPERFQAMLRRVRSHADLLIYNSQQTRRHAEAHMQKWGPVPPGTVAHLGVTVPTPDPSAVPKELDLSRPYFVTVGTIEPRKNHFLLLDIWEDMISASGIGAVPGLLICGARGWANERVFDRLDRLPAGGPVRELSGLTDTAVSALVAGACAALFPSVAEGFGLPPAEAAALGVPVVCCDIPVYREILGDIPVYLGETDRYQWRKTIETLAKGRVSNAIRATAADFVPPSWNEHFNAVLKLT